MNTPIDHIAAEAYTEIVNETQGLLDALDEYRESGREKQKLFAVHSRERKLRKLMAAEYHRQQQQESITQKTKAA